MTHEEFNHAIAWLEEHRDDPFDPHRKAVITHGIVNVTRGTFDIADLPAQALTRMEEHPGEDFVVQIDGLGRIDVLRRGQLIDAEVADIGKDHTGYLEPLDLPKPTGSGALAGYAQALREHAGRALELAEKCEELVAVGWDLAPEPPARRLVAGAASHRHARRVLTGRDRAPHLHDHFDVPPEHSSGGTSALLARRHETTSGAMLAPMSTPQDQPDQHAEDPLGDQDASDLNRELTDLLVRAGRDAGFEVKLEYPVRGGRLDVVWTWTPSSPFPGFDQAVPVVGFEIESSWRTRKHVKGDLLNLQDAGVGLGVIVLAGTSSKDDSLRRFAQVLVDRPGPTVLVWTADDVRALAEKRDHASLLASATTPSPAAPPAVDEEPPAAARQRPGGDAVAHTGKYAPLYRWLQLQDGPTLTVTFRDVEEVLGLQLPASCRKETAHWHGYDGSAVARAIIDAGWEASRVHLADEELTLIKTP